MANNATTVEQICGICHEPVEDLVVSFYFFKTSFLIVLFHLILFSLLAT